MLSIAQALGERHAAWAKGVPAHAQALPGAVTETNDFSEGMRRTEVRTAHTPNLLQARLATALSNTGDGGCLVTLPLVRPFSATASPHTRSRHFAGYNTCHSALRRTEFAAEYKRAYDAAACLPRVANWITASTL